MTYTVSSGTLNPTQLQPPIIMSAACRGVVEQAVSGMLVGMRWSQPKSASVGCEFHMKNPSDADADLSPDQNLLVLAIIATVIQLSYFCVRL